MPTSIVPKASAFFVGLSMLAMTAYTEPIRGAYPALPKSPSGTTAGSVAVKQTTISGAIKMMPMHPRLASKAAALKLRLQTFKDTKKAEIAERVNTNLNNVNQNRTSQMQKHLETMSSILDRLEARVNKQTPDIKDPVSAKAAIAAARETIATTSAAVSEQALKDYTIQVTSETRIRIDAKTQRDKLHTDLLALRKKVIDAKQAVANAIKVAKSGPVQEGTTSGQQ